jgi:hypothetical protein
MTSSPVTACAPRLNSIPLAISNLINVFIHFLYDKEPSGFIILSALLWSNPNNLQNQLLTNPPIGATLLREASKLSTSKANLSLIWDKDQLQANSHAGYRCKACQIV